MIKIEIGIMCHAAYASIDKYDWTLSIRKKDDSEVGKIAKYHKETIDSQLLRDYLPGWENIAWRKLKTPRMFPQELMGECGEYRLNIILSGKSKKTEDAIKQEFLEFMQL